MKGIVHPFSGALHEQDGEGNIRVTNGDLVGIFGTDGHWISGELRECDAQLCGWVGGPPLGSSRLKADTTIVVEPTATFAKTKETT